MRGVARAEVGWPVFGLPPWKKYRRRDRAHLVPPRRMDAAVCRTEVLSFRSEAREASDSEPPRLNHAGRRRGGRVAVWAQAQQPGMPVIGYLSARSPEDTTHLVAAFRRGLAENGYVEGQNVAIEYRWARGQVDRLPALAAELAGRSVAILVA